MVAQSRAQNQVGEVTWSPCNPPFSSDLALLPFSDPLHTYMVYHLLHTVMPAMDSRFTETAKNLSVALGSGEGVSRRRHGRVADVDSTEWPPSGPAESHGHHGRLHQVAPRWKHCLLETERGFDSVFTKVLGETFHGVHREVSSYHRGKEHNRREFQM